MILSVNSEELPYLSLIHILKEAVEKMFEGTKVASVNTMNCEGKKKRVRGTFKFGKTAGTKKAVVKLTADSADIEIFEGL